MRARPVRAGCGVRVGPGDCCCFGAWPRCAAQSNTGPAVQGFFTEILISAGLQEGRQTRAENVPSRLGIVLVAKQLRGSVGARPICARALTRLHAQVSSTGVHKA
jgi:hypothetical protein